LHVETALLHRSFLSKTYEKVRRMNNPEEIAIYNNPKKSLEITYAKKNKSSSCDNLEEI